MRLQQRQPGLDLLYNLVLGEAIALSILFDLPLLLCGLIAEWCPPSC
jgi:hypothetical protein